ncbi:MAG: phosphoribosylamine--glycine ligase [Thermoleophilia bacterium]|nr:phosphoribosylamine--glycine ligase [Thermoleophilia bacterium]
MLLIWARPAKLPSMPASNSHPEMSRLRVLVIGGGGRDHALCHAFAVSPRLAELHVAPGNAGIAQFATCHPDVDLGDLDGLVAVAIQLAPDLVIIGAEDLLVAGLASRMAAAGLTCLGPSGAAAQLEGSKRFAKQLMERAHVPTPAWRSCDSVEAAHAAIEELGGAVAVKADGLAAGLGAFVCPTPALAREAVEVLMVERRFGVSGDRVLVEQLVTGEEASVMAIVDGSSVVPLPAARDYKRLGDDDAGPNTGGMGAYAPSAELDPAEAARLARAVIQPIVDQLREAGTPFHGVIYAGVMLTSDGPQVLEYNSRFGNPETQALVRVLDADLLDLLDRAAHGTLPTDVDVAATGHAVAVCVAAEHYPTLQLEPQPVRVTGLDAARAIDGVELFLGLATRVDGSTDEIDALGGRVVTVSAWAPQLELAIERAYAAATHIRVPGRQMRTDIGQAGLASAAR